MDLLYFLKALYKKKWLILLCVFIAVVAAWYFTRNEKRTYKSTAQIATGFTMNDAVDLNNNASNIYGSDLKFNNTIETITSPQVLNLLSCRLILHDLNKPKEAFRRLLKDAANAQGFDLDLKKAKQIFEEKLQDMKMLSSYDPEERKLLNFLAAFGYDQKSLERMLVVYRLNRTDYVNIECHSDNPLLSAFAVNALCHEFNRFYVGYFSQRTESNLRFLDTLVKQKQRALTESQNALKKVLTGDDADIAATTAGLLGQYQTRLSSRKSDLTVAELSLNAVKKQLVDLEARKKTTNDINHEIIQLTSKINELTSQYVQGGSSDQNLQNTINSLKDQLQQKYAAIPSHDPNQPTQADLLQKKTALEVQAQSAQADINSLQRSINSLSSNIRSNSGKSIMTQSLQKDVELAMSDYNNAKAKYDLARNNLALGSQFKQILFGQPSLTPERSKRLIIIALAGAVTLVLSVLVIVLIEYFDVSVKMPSHFQKQTGLKVLNVTNWVNLKKYTVLEVVSKEASKEERRKNTFRELVRKIRQSLGETDKKVILFTSTEHGQGKTTLMQALAYSMSLSKKKVLLIDTNFCNNDLTVQLNAKQIMEEYSSKEPLDQKNIESLIIQTKIAGVDAIGCKGGDYSPQEVLPPGNLLEHLEELKEHYNYIFLEAAPMNAFTDVKELIDYADGVITIFSAESVIKPADSDAIEYLKNLNGKFQGAILNKVELENLEA